MLLGGEVQRKSFLWGGGRKVIRQGKTRVSAPIFFFPPALVILNWAPHLTWAYISVEQVLYNAFPPLYLLYNNH